MATRRLHKFTIYSIGIIAQLTVCSASIELQDFLIDQNLNLWLGVEDINLPEHYSPAFGIAMKSSGFLNNLRFLGNYDKSTVGRMNEAGDVFLRDRRYDAGRDNIMKLIIQLFPSNTADQVDCLESVWNSQRNLGHFFQQKLESDKPQTLRRLAGLMLKAEVFRLSLNGQNPFIPAIPAVAYPKPVHSFFQKSDKINPPAWAHLGDISDQERDFLTDNFQYLLNKRMGIKGFNTLLVNALQDEVSAGYQQYTVEHSLLAFIFDLVRNKEDAQLLLREWSGLRARTFLPSYLENDQYMPSRNHEVLSKTLNECIVRLTSATHELPYKNPANTGQVPQWITQPDGSRVKCRTFPDCVETSIRHIFNYSLGHTGMRVFKKEAIRDRVRAMFPNEGQLRGDDRLAELEDFYQTIHDPNDATGFARSQWNLVTFGLNSEDEMNSPHHVIYAHLKDLPNSGNNIRSNVCNTLKTIGGILGIRAATVMEDINDLDDVLARLNDLLSLINDSNTYKLQLVTADINPGQDFKSFESSVVIDITVILKNKYSNGSHYTFAMNNLAGHSFIMVLNNKDSTIYTGFNGISGPERNLFSYFFGGYEGQSLYSHVFSLPFLGKFNSMLTNAVRDYENIRDANLQEALQTVFGKVASRISLAHTEVASDLYQSILLACNFNNTTYQIVRHAACDPDTLPPDLENVTLHLSQDEAQLFDMSHNNGFTTSLALSGAISQIIGEGRLPTHIKSLKLTLLGRAMEHLDLTHFSELTSLELYCASLNGFKPPVNGKLKSYTIEDQIYET